MKGNISISTTVVKEALQAECTNCGLSFTAEDTNADLCVKIDNFKNA